METKIKLAILGDVCPTADYAQLFESQTVLTELLPVIRDANYTELALQRLWINHYATDFWGCSEEAQESLFTEADRTSDRAQVIHNAVDLEAFLAAPQCTIRQELEIPEEALVIGTVGRIAQVKHYELAADTIRALWDRNVNCHYVAAAENRQPVFLQQIADAVRSAGFDVSAEAERVRVLYDA